MTLGQHRVRRMGLHAVPGSSPIYFRRRWRQALGDGRSSARVHLLRVGEGAGAAQGRDESPVSPSSAVSIDGDMLTDTGSFRVNDLNLCTCDCSRLFFC